MAFRVIHREGSRIAPTSETTEDSGAVLLEFAVLLPLLVSLMLGITSGGIALSQKISLDNASREAARFGATLPIDGNLQIWLADVGDVAVGAAAGDLDLGVAGRTVCVTYVSPGADPSDQTTMYVLDEDDSVTYTVGQQCFDDNRPGSERRVQVQLLRDTRFEAGFFSNPVTLDAEASVKFERFES